MIKILRKYKGWLMAGFLVLLMMTWLIGPAMEKLGRSASNVAIGKLDGKTLYYEQQVLATQELYSLEQFAPFLTREVLGIADRDVTHWMLLVKEATDAGLVGDEGDGEAFVPELAESILRMEMMRDFRLQMQIQDEKTFREAADRYAQSAEGAFAQQKLAKPQMHLAMAKARGVFRLLSAYRQSLRLSDRAAAALAKNSLDAAIIDHVTIPGTRLADTIPEPTDSQLQAHFDRFKALRPGEGQFALGYLLPSRVRIEYMRLSRTAIEAKIELDPIEVNKRFKESPAKYGSDFASARSAIERELKADRVAKIMEDARSAVQTEVVRGTRHLQADPADSRYKLLPTDWRETRPKFEAIAQAVVDQVKRTQGVSIDRPEVVIRAGEWLTQSELAALPGIGTSVLRQGSIEVPFAEVTFWCKELGGERGIIPVQTLLPLGDGFFTDRMGDRYYLTILETRGESAPDSIAERREQLVKDYRELVAYEQLKARLDELRVKAVAGGLDAVAEAFAKPAPPPVTPGAEAGKPDKPEVRKFTQVQRENVSNRDPDLDTKDSREAILKATAAFDPLRPWAEIEADRATLALSNDSRRSISIARILAPSPLTVESYRAQDEATLARAYRAAQADADQNAGPFSLASLLTRHEYFSGDKRINKPEDLRSTDADAAGG
ncbi:MAG: hypothetical protein ACKVW3_10365 [Phycisphaerales bacterium]